MKGKKFLYLSVLLVLICTLAFPNVCGQDGTPCMEGMAGCTTCNFVPGGGPGGPTGPVTLPSTTPGFPGNPPIPLNPVPITGIPVAPPPGPGPSTTGPTAPIGPMGGGGFSDADVKASLDTTMTSKFYGNPKIKCVMDKLMQGNQFKKTINNFTGTNARINLHFDLGQTKDPMADGETVPVPANWNTQDISVMINEGLLNTNTALQAALTLLHEGIHAELFRLLLTIKGPSHLTGSDFPTLFKYYNEYKGGQSPQHQLMAAHYISVLGKALQEFDGNKFTPEYYKSLAWDGLRETDAYKSLSQEEKDNITKLKEEVLKGRGKDGCN
jgi:hypothetical protein